MNKRLHQGRLVVIFCLYMILMMLHCAMRFLAHCVRFERLFLFHFLLCFALLSHLCMPLQGTVIIREKRAQVVKQRADGTPVERQVATPVLVHVDIISDAFWEAHQGILL